MQIVVRQAKALHCFAAFVRSLQFVAISWLGVACSAKFS